MPPRVGARRANPGLNDAIPLGLATPRPGLARKDHRSALIEEARIHRPCLRRHFHFPKINRGSTGISPWRIILYPPLLRCLRQPLPETSSALPVPSHAPPASSHQLTIPSHRLPLPSHALPEASHQLSVPNHTLSASNHHVFMGFFGLKLFSQERFKSSRALPMT